MDRGERDLDLDDERSLLRLREFSFSVSTPSLVLATERELFVVFVVSPLTRSIKIKEKNNQFYNKYKIRTRYSVYIKMYQNKNFFNAGEYLNLNIYIF